MLHSSGYCSTLTNTFSLLRVANSMDFQRIILGSTLAVITYMLVLQWGKDYGTQPVVVEQPQTVSVYGSTSSASDAPSLAVPSSSADTDKPLTDIPESSSTADAKATGQLISVKTDVLNVLIDTKFSKSTVPSNLTTF